MSFLSCYGHPRYLHSFPTRRSSDLRTRPRSPHTAAVRTSPRSYPAPLGPPAHSPHCFSRHDRCSRQRSEEHTSELQSRGHLVCRLLLEKKKTTKIKEMKHCQ